MKSVVLAAAAGVLFALGLVISGMAVPAKITAFLDVAGRWDPSLAFVMAGAIGVLAPLARRVRRRAHPWFDDRFHVPDTTAIDLALVGGAAIFGIGWGLSGYCPGPAIVSLGGGATGTIVFVAAVMVSTEITRRVRQ